MFLGSNFLKSVGTLCVCVDRCVHASERMYRTFAFAAVMLALGAWFLLICSAL